MRPGASGSPGMTSSSPVKKRPRRTFLKTGSVLIPTEAARPVSCGSRRFPAGRISEFLRMSLPTYRTQSPGPGFFLTTTESSTASVSSWITTASPPDGIGAPVKMRAAVPGSSGLPTEPAMIFWLTRSFPFLSRSELRTAYPSMALLSMGGTSIVERCARARMRPLASRAGTSSTAETGTAPARSCPRASSTERSPLFMELEVRGDEFRDRRIVVQVEHRKLGAHRAVARHRHDMRVVGVQQAFPGFGAPDLELRDRRELEALDDEEVARREALHLLLEPRLVGAAQLVHQHPAPRRGDQDLGRARMAVAVGVLARLIDVERVMSVLDERYAQPAADEARDQLLDEGGFSASGPAGKAEDLHCRDFKPSRRRTSCPPRRCSPGSARRRRCGARARRRSRNRRC